jgi:hypothetical protein
MNYQYNILESVSFKRNRAKRTNPSTVISSATQKTLPITLTGKKHPIMKKRRAPLSNAALMIQRGFNLNIPQFLNSKLYQKYSSSQIYYYKKDINSIVNKQRVPAVIKWKDEKDYLVNDEVMKRFYYREEYKGKFGQLTEYYKFHREIPRVFSKAEYDMYFDYHDRKRKVEFVRITNMLKLDNGEDPHLEKKLEMIRIRNKIYSPMLKDLSTFIRSSYRVDTRGNNDISSLNSNVLPQYLTKAYSN